MKNKKSTNDKLTENYLENVANDYQERYYNEKRLVDNAKEILKMKRKDRKLAIKNLKDNLKDTIKVHTNTLTCLNELEKNMNWYREILSLLSLSK